jgi:hypothetical protein
MATSDRMKRFRERVARPAPEPSRYEMFESLVTEYEATLHSGLAAGVVERRWAGLWADIARAYADGQLSDAEYDRLRGRMP